MSIDDASDIGANGCVRHYRLLHSKRSLTDNQDVHHETITYVRSNQEGHSAFRYEINEAIAHQKTTIPDNL